jgi:hypothetical protein
MMAERTNYELSRFRGSIMLIDRLRRLCSILAVAGFLIIPLTEFSSRACSQSISQDVIVAPASQVAQLGHPLEKVADYFYSQAFPSIVVGYSNYGGRHRGGSLDRVIRKLVSYLWGWAGYFGFSHSLELRSLDGWIRRRLGDTLGGIYLYTSTSDTMAGPWQQTAIYSPGSAYESAVAFTYPGDTYPGVIASIQPAGSSRHQIIWYQNPKNRGLDPTKVPWGVQVINPDAGCHDIRLADMDGDGKLDVICSASALLGTSSFIAFQNSHDSWQVVYNIANLGDGVDVIAIAGQNSPNLVGGAVTDGNVYWYENPCKRVPFQQSMPCGVSRTAGWKAHRINSGNIGDASGNSFTTIMMNGIASVITASNETDSPVGVAWFYPGPNPLNLWNYSNLDTTYSSVHQISTGTWNDGAPYVIAAEEEQACQPYGSSSARETPCRIAMFQYVDSSWQQTVLLQTSTHNQSVLPWGIGLFMADSNHGVFGADRSVHARVIQP